MPKCTDLTVLNIGTKLAFGGNLAGFNMGQSRKTLQICRIYSGKILGYGVIYSRTIIQI